MPTLPSDLSAGYAVRLDFLHASPVSFSLSFSSDNHLLPLGHSAPCPVLRTVTCINFSQAMSEFGTFSRKANTRLIKSTNTRSRQVINSCGDKSSSVCIYSTNFETRQSQSISTKGRSNVSNNPVQFSFFSFSLFFSFGACHGVRSTG
jgi:hypothetical protein